MKIAAITPFTVSYPEPNDNNNTRYLTFCRAEAQDGTVGWGEAISQFAESTRATAALIEGMAQHVVGQSAMDNIAIWRAIKAGSWWYGWHGGLASFAISAIDIALWDLKGKLLGLPLIDLLGGATRDRLPVIASTHVFDPSLEAEADRHGRYVQEQGYQGVKIGMGKKGGTRLGYEFARDVEFTRLLREAIGPEAMLMMDRGQSLRWTVADAIRRTNAFEEYGLTWIEEPLEPSDLVGFEKFRPHVKCLVATGEREFDARGYREFIASGAVDVVGCDVGRAEGITGALKVIELVEAYDVVQFARLVERRQHRGLDRALGLHAALPAPRAKAGAEPDAGRARHRTLPPARRVHRGAPPAGARRRGADGNPREVRLLRERPALP